MGIRMSQGKNKKSPRPVAAMTVKREDALRKVTKRRPRRSTPWGPSDNESRKTISRF